MQGEGQVAAVVGVGGGASRRPARARLRAATVSRVAPQTPTCPSLTRRQGPMQQFLQQAPSAPIGQGFMFGAVKGGRDAHFRRLAAQLRLDLWSSAGIGFSSMCT